jgi:hypothetical protein
MKPANLSRRLRTFAAAILFAGALSACHSDSSSPSGAGQPASISGQGFDGPVASGTVTAFAVTGGGAKGSALATTTTDAGGNYSVHIDNYTGTVLIEIVGGTYIDAATGSPVTLTEVLSAVVNGVDPGDQLTVQITPLTTLAVARALGSPGGMTPANVSAAIAAISTYFGGLDIVGIAPIDTSVAGSATGAATAAVDYGLILGALAAQAAALGLPDGQELIAALAADIADGIFDGLDDGEPIDVGESVLDPATGTSDLGDAIAAFSGEDEANVSGGVVSPGIVSSLQNPEPPSVPTGVMATAGNGQVSVSWTAVSGASSYNVYVGTEPGVSKASFSEKITGVTSPAVVTGLTNDTAYYFVVTALNPGAESAESAEDSATPTAVTYTIGGSVSGLDGSGLVLRNNGGDDKSISANGPYTFTTGVTSGGTYNVTVQTQPAGQTCVVSNGSGTVAGANVSNVGVTCTDTGGGGNSATVNVTSATPTSGNGLMVVSGVTVTADTLNGDPVTRVRVTGTLNGLDAQFQLYYVTATSEVVNASLSWDSFPNANFVFKDPDAFEVLIDKPNGQINLDIVNMNDADGIIIIVPTKTADVSATINVTPPLP